MDDAGHDVRARGDGENLVGEVGGAGGLGLEIMDVEFHCADSLRPAG